MKPSTCATLCLALCLSWGCTTTTPTPDTPTQLATKKAQPSKPGISGKVSIDEGLTLPKGSKTIVLWSVSATSPDYIYAYGRGTIDEKGFTVSMDASTPPGEALNANVMGVALLLVVPPTLALPPSGKLTREVFRELYEKAIGISSNHGLIFRAKELGPASKVEWLNAFKPGSYQCGEGRPAKAGQTFDYFVPVTCDKVIIKITKSKDWVNWT